MERINSLDAANKLPKDIKDIFVGEMVARWDIENWKSYLFQYEQGLIQCTDADLEQEYIHCKNMYKKAVKKHKEILDKYAEYFL